MRITVRRKLKKLLAEAKCFLKNEPWVSDCDIVYGSYDEEATKRAITNAQTDVDQLEFVLKCLDNREEIEKNNTKIIDFVNLQDYTDEDYKKAN